MAVHYTRRKETIENETTFRVTPDMVLPGMETARPRDGVDDSVQIAVEVDVSDGIGGDPMPVTCASGKGRGFSWWRFLGGLLLAAVLLALLIWIGAQK